MKLNRKTVGIVLAVVAVAGVAAYFMLHGGKSQVQVNFETAKVETATIGSSITATGTIEAVTTVEVGTQVSGIIDKIYVDYNSEVKKGQVIAELDKTNLTSEYTSALSNLSNAQSNLRYQKSNYERYKTLYDKGLVSANDFESARLSYQQAQATERVQQQNVSKARTNLGYATITAPIDGVVLSKAVEEGQTVAASFNTPTLFTIAQDLTDMRVIADVDEADIGGVVQGQRVSFTVDAYPDDVFEGSVTQVRQEATTESNVVTYEVVISAPNKDLKLKPGLTANVTIYTLEKNNVLAISSKALRFTPSDKLLENNQSIQDCKAKDKVWKKEGDVFKAYPIQTGITNGTLTEIVSGLKEGDRILTEISATADNDAQEEQEKNPFMMRPRRNNKQTGGNKSK
ncbi:MAG: efflux RND transporter periplasmic adaptor subunit [Prevotellaceae bacterium]|nr:efflux RND transporter periplasmic adaptor subunit [Prevotellaceae bacterium]